MRVYIAGALSTKPSGESCGITQYLANVSRMCQAASQVRKKGHYPYVSGLDFLLGVVNGDWGENDYRGLGMSFLEVCDAVLVISQSWGVAKEVERAKELGILVYYRIEDLP